MRHAPAARQGSAIVLYLAWRGGWTHRDEIASLLWADHADAAARRNLRQALFRLRSSTLASTLEIEPDRLRFIGDTDVELYSEAVAQRDWSTAVALWRGPFLAGWTIARAPDVERWISACRDELTSSRRTALTERARELERSGDLLEAARHWGLAWRDDVLDEGALRAQLDLLERAEEREAATREARAFAASFERQLGFAPDLPETSVKQAPRAAIDTPTLTEASRADHLTPAALPLEPTPFVGRERELATLMARLDDSEVRWLTLVGIGGVGKSRLALAAAQRAVRMGRVVAWASLTALAADEDVSAALAHALGITLRDAVTLETVARTVGDTEALLVIDNAELFAEELREAIATLSKRCPRLSVLVTSRTAFGANAEHRLLVRGLGFGPDAPHNDAASLFIAAARRRGADPVVRSQQETIAEICREVGGLPLALELLGAWADVLAPREMLTEIRNGLDILSSDAPDLPPRHRSLDVVLDASYGRLSDEARDAFLALAPFRGGFDLSAARSVGVTPHRLKVLVQSSLVQRSNGRFARHPLVARFARDRARADPATWRRARERHADHYLGLLDAACAPLLRRSDVGDARTLYLSDQANVREAVLWTAESDDTRKFVDAYHGYGLLKDAFTPVKDIALVQDGLQRSRGAIHEHMVVSNVHVDIALARSGLDSKTLSGHEDRLKQVVCEADRLGDRLLALRAHRRLARLRLRASDPIAAVDHATRAIEALQGHTSDWGWVGMGGFAGAYRTRATTRSVAGEYDAARQDLLRSIRLFRRMLDDPAPLELGRMLRLDVAFGRLDAALEVLAEMESSLGQGAPIKARVEVLLDRVRLQLARGDADAVRDACIRGLALASERPVGLQNDRHLAFHGVLAHLALLEGEDRVVEAHLERAAETPANVARLAGLQMVRGAPHEAAHEARRALASLPYPFLHPFSYGFAGALLALAYATSGDSVVGSRKALDQLWWALESRSPPEVARALVPVAVACLIDPPGEAERLLRMVHAHPASDATTRWLAGGMKQTKVQPATGGLDGRATASLMSEADRLLARLRP